MIDISRLNILGQLQRATAQGPKVADDTALVATGTVYEVDAAGGRVRVGLRDGDVWLPAIAGRYVASSLVRVLLDATAGRPVLVLGPVQPQKPAVLGIIVAGPTSGILTVKIEGGQYDVPAPMGAYTVGESAWILLDGWGAPMLALGPSSTITEDSGDSEAPASGGSTVVATATIGPQVSATYRSGYGWDRWNTNRYGGASSIYQGNAFGSGVLIGFAGYGDQIANLGAISIDEITMAARKVDTNGLSAALTVQGTAAGSRPGGAPAPGAFDTASTPTIGPGAWGSLTFPPGLREAFRTGAAKGLVAVGGAYGGFGGTSTPGSFVLQIRYTKAA